MNQDQAWSQIVAEQLTLKEIATSKPRLIMPGFWSGAKRRQYGRILIDGVEHCFRHPADMMCACQTMIPMVKSEAGAWYIEATRAKLGAQAEHPLDVCEHCATAARRHLLDWRSPPPTPEERELLRLEREGRRERIHNYPRNP